MPPPIRTIPPPRRRGSRLLGAREVGGARARVQGAEVPRGRPVELDVAAAAVAAVQLVPAVKAGLGRVDDVAVLYQPDVELVSSAWFAGVIGPRSEEHTSELQSPVHL